MGCVTKMDNSTGMKSEDNIKDVPEKMKITERRSSHLEEDLEEVIKHKKSSDYKERLPHRH